MDGWRNMRARAHPGQLPFARTILEGHNVEATHMTALFPRVDGIPSICFVLSREASSSPRLPETICQFGKIRLAVVGRMVRRRIRR